MIADDVIVVLTDELPTVIFDVDTLTFAPTLIPVVAFAVVVLRSPLSVVRPVTFNVLERATAPTMLAVPFTLNVASGDVVPTPTRLFVASTNNVLVLKATFVVKPTADVN